jgi:hypothetical protein
MSEHPTHFKWIEYLAYIATIIGFPFVFYQIRELRSGGFFAKQYCIEHPIF